MRDRPLSADPHLRRHPRPARTDPTGVRVRPRRNDLLVRHPGHRHRRIAMHRATARMDSVAFTGLLGELIEQHGPIFTLVMDNGSAHTSRHTTAWLAEHPGSRWPTPGPCFLGQPHRVSLRHLRPSAAAPRSLLRTRRLRRPGSGLGRPPQHSPSASHLHLATQRMITNFRTRPLARSRTPAQCGLRPCPAAGPVPCRRGSK